MVSGTVARIPISMRRPRSISPSWQVTVVVPVQVPCVAVADITDTPGGSTSVSVTAGDVAGPRFATDRAYEKLVPAITGSRESRFTIARSVTVPGSISVDTEAALLLPSGSAVTEVTLAVF